MRFFNALQEWNFSSIACIFDYYWANIAVTGISKNFKCLFLICPLSNALFYIIEFHWKNFQYLAYIDSILEINKYKNIPHNIGVTCVTLSK